MTKTAHADFAERLKLALDEAGLGKSQQKELGVLFKVSPQAVKKWLDGEALPVSRRASAVASLLGVRRAWLFDDELPMRPHQADMAETGSDYRSKEAISISGEEFRLLSNYRRLPRKLQEAMSQLADDMQIELRKELSIASRKNAGKAQKK